MPAAAERAIRYNWQSTAENFYSGAAAPLTADASNPLTPTATGSTTVTAGQLFYNGGATGMAMGIREVALFQAGTNLSDAAANAIVAGMLARSSAAA